MPPRPPPGPAPFPKEPQHGGRGCQGQTGLLWSQAEDQRLDLATRSSSSFFLIAYELEEPLAALMSSSARHSAMVLMFLKAASRAPVHSSQIA